MFLFGCVFQRQTEHKQKHKNFLLIKISQHGLSREPFSNHNNRLKMKLIKLRHTVIFYSVHPCIVQHIVVHVVTSSTQDVDITIAIR